MLTACLLPQESSRRLRRLFFCDLTDTAVAHTIERMLSPTNLKPIRLWGVLIFTLVLIVGIAATAVDIAAQDSGDHFVFLPIINHVTDDPIPFGPIHSGEGTYYVEADGSGNCTFDPTPDDLMVAAANTVDYDDAALCGAYAAVTGPKSSVIVRIVDRCPGCAAGDLDFSPEAFAQIADLPQGRVPITWQLVSPPLDGPILYHFKADSHQWWASVQIRNHRNPIMRFEYLNSSGVFQEVTRASYNQYEMNGIGLGPFTFRVTDVFGNTIVDSGIFLVPGGDVASQSQFPPP